MQKIEKLQDFVVVLVQGELQKKSAGMSNAIFCQPWDSNPV